MKTFLNLFIISLFLISCGGEEPEEMQVVEEKAPNEAIEQFNGQYYIGIRQEGSDQIVLQENCWSMQIDMFELSEFAGSPNEYYFAFHGHHSTMYLVESGIMDEETLVFKGVLEDESSEEVFEYKLTKVANDVYELTHQNEVYLLIPEDAKKNFPFVLCEEETEPMSELDYMNEIFKVLFALKEGGEDLSEFFPEEGIELVLPGQGVGPLETTVYNAEEITATSFFNTPAYNRLLEYVQMHNNEERAFLEFVDELPDRCMPKTEALFVKTTSVEKTPIVGTAMLTKMNDEQGEVYTYVTVYFEYTDKMRIIKIDTSGCEA